MQLQQSHAPHVVVRRGKRGKRGRRRRRETVRVSQVRERDGLSFPRENSSAKVQPCRYRFLVVPAVSSSSSRRVDHVGIDRDVYDCTRSVFRGGVLVLVASQRAIVVVGATTELRRRYPLLSRMLTCSWCATASISTALAAARCRGYIRIRIRYSYSRSKQVELRSGMIDRSVQQQQFECRYEPYSSLRQ